MNKLIFQVPWPSEIIRIMTLICFSMVQIFPKQLQNAKLLFQMFYHDNVD